MSAGRVSRAVVRFEVQTGCGGASALCGLRTQEKTGYRVQASDSRLPSTGNSFGSCVSAPRRFIRSERGSGADSRLKKGPRIPSAMPFAADGVNNGVRGAGNDRPPRDDHQLGDRGARSGRRDRRRFAVRGRPPIAGRVEKAKGIVELATVRIARVGGSGKTAPEGPSETAKAYCGSRRTARPQGPCAVQVGPTLEDATTIGEGIVELAGTGGPRGGCGAGKTAACKARARRRRAYCGSRRKMRPYRGAGECRLKRDIDGEGIVDRRGRGGSRGRCGAGE